MTMLYTYSAGMGSQSDCVVNMNLMSDQELLKIQLDELRRETGIDREIQNARRAVEDAVPRDLRSPDLRRKAREGLDSAVRAAEVGPEDVEPIPPAKRDVSRAAGSSEEGARAEPPPQESEDAAQGG